MHEPTLQLQHCNGTTATTKRQPHNYNYWTAPAKLQPQRCSHKATTTKLNIHHFNYMATTTDLQLQHNNYTNATTHLQLQKITSTKSGITNTTHINMRQTQKQQRQKRDCNKRLLQQMTTTTNDHYNKRQRQQMTTTTNDNHKTKRNSRKQQLHEQHLDTPLLQTSTRNEYATTTTAANTATLQYV